MGTSSRRGRDQHVLQRKLDLEAGAGWQEATRTRIQRIVFFRTRYLLVSVCILFLCVVLVLAGLSYIGRHQPNGIQLPSLYFPHWNPASFDATQPLPRHPHYIIFEQPPVSHESLADRPLKSTSRLPEHCLESHFALGYPCFNNKPTTFDMVWTWVNGSDPRLREAMSEAALAQYPEIGRAGKDLVASTSSPNSKLYRDHDELRHSFRSVLQHFRPYVKKFHLLTSDFPFSIDEYTQFGSPAEDISNSTHSSHQMTRRLENDLGEDGADKTSFPESVQVIANRTLRMGQLPSWLSTEEQDLWSDGDVKVKVTYQAQVFQNYSGTSFNSYSIETQLPNLPDVQQNFIYLNDDFFFTADLVPSDFYTSAYGIVLRLDPTLLVAPVPLNSKVSPAGEWGPLGYSSWLLSERFGSRPRPYPIHAAKSFSMPLLDEVARIWEDEFNATASHKFRGMKTPGTNAGDAYMSFLLTHLVVERWREALLWSWVIGRIGGDEDEWGEEQQSVAWEELGGDPEDVGRKVTVRITQRKTVEGNKVFDTLQASGETYSKKTAYTFSSADGYPYSYANRKGKMAWPRFSGNSIGQQLCNLDFDTCIGSASSASEAFKTIAFDKPIECGDCIIGALRSSSGVLGLSAFLPPRQRKFKSSVAPSLWDKLLHFDVGGGSDDDDYDDDDVEQEGPPVPHLPLVKNWTEGNFSLKAVLEPYGAVNIRTWTLRLMERYRFVFGETNIVFLMIEDLSAARSGLMRVTNDVALLCMNDDVKRQHERTDKVLRDWQEHRWRKPAEWER